MSDDSARQAFDEARELFYAARLLSSTTSQPIHVVSLLKRSILMLCRALAATTGVSSTTREDVIAAVEHIDTRERVLQYPLLRELALLDELERRAADLSATVTADEARELSRLIDAMPHALASARQWIAFRKLGPRRRALGRRVNRVTAVIVAGLGLAGLLAAALTVGRWGYDVVAGRNLHGAYYIGADFDRFVLERRDGAVDFNWGSGAPSAALPVDGFSVRWDGMLRVPKSGRYTFFLESDDGARLLVADRMVIDNWSARGESDRQESVDIQAGVVPIRLDYHEISGIAFVRLLWSPPGGGRSLVGRHQFVR